MELCAHLKGLIGHDSVVFCGAEWSSGRSIYYTQTLGEVLTKYQDRLDCYLHQLPYISYYLKNPGGSVMRISDLVSVSEWERCELMNEALKPMGIVEQMGVEIPGDPRQMRGLLLNRDRRSFSISDLKLFNIVKEHVIAASAVVTQWQRMEEKFSPQEDQALRSGMIILDAEARPISWSPMAVKLLNEYAGMEVSPNGGRSLPSTLHQWILRQVALLHDPELWALPRRPFHLQQNQRLLTLSLSSAEEGRGHTLLMEESWRQLQTAAGLKRLTGREREVLSWLARGKTNEQIGCILNMSIHTVKNHVKRILNTLGVDNRTAAASMFLEGRSL